jgi:SAM-dependent methyltransferase
MPKDEIFLAVENYYSEKIQTFGPTSQGVDWNGEASQQLRFAQLSKVISLQKDFSVLDWGCGYGAYIDFLRNLYPESVYQGYDIAPQMLEYAKHKYPNEDFTHHESEINVSDFTLASGIFNVKMGFEEADWRAYIIDTLERINKKSRRGFSFNMLTTYSDEAYKKPHLYYASPAFFFDYCKQYFSRNVALLHDYDLYEFTLIIRK